MMQRQMTKLFLKMQMKLREGLRKLSKEEKGAADIVAIILIIVVVIAVAIIFKDTVTRAMERIMEDLGNFVGL